MLGKCVQECIHGPTHWKYTTDGGENGDGVYDIDPNDPIAKYFEFSEAAINEEIAKAAEDQEKERLKKLSAIKGEKRGPGRPRA